MAFANRPFSFAKARAELVPFAIRVGEPVVLLTSGTFHGLLLGERSLIAGLPFAILVNETAMRIANRSALSERAAQGNLSQFNSLDA